MSEAEYKTRYIEFAKPFMDGVLSIYETMVHVELTPGKPYIKDSNRSLGDYSALMGIAGEVQFAAGVKSFKGSLAISWPVETYLSTAKNMLGVEAKEINEEISDLGMEICNMTMGTAKSALVEKGFKIDLSIPTAIQGKHHVLYVEDKIITVVTPFSSVIGEFYIEVNFDLV